MSSLTINDLLPIPEGTKQPHAYQIFGLEVGENDAATIKSAVKATVRRLKEVKETTDPRLWNQAAKLVQQAKQVLADPEMKSKLDARFGIVQVASSAPASPSTSAVGTSSAASDPLAALLPTSDPLAAVLPAADPMAPSPGVAMPPPNSAPFAATEPPHPSAPPNTNVPPAMPPGMFGTAPDSPASANDSLSPVLVKKPSRASYRRRRSTLGTLVFLTFAFGMIALIGGLGYFLFFGPGQLAISKSNDGLKITTGPTDTEGMVKINEQNAATSPKKQRRPVDNVMGDMAGDVPPPPRPVTNPPLDPADTDSSTAEMATAEMPAAEMPVTSNADAANPATGSEPMMPVVPATTTPSEEMSEEMVAAAEEKIAKVRELLRTAKWKEMKPAAAKLIEETMTDEQAERAESLYQLADLASFYRGGVERGVASLTVGNDFEVTESFRVIIVEKGEDLLVVRFNAKNKSYTFDEFPFSLAQKLATFAMQVETPTSRAAMAAYQAISPKATVEHRQEAIQWLESIDEEVEGADPKRVAETIKSLFSDET